MKNETKEKKVQLYESHGDLFGNTNSAFSKTHLDELTKDRATFDKSNRENRVQHKLINGKAEFG